MADLTFTIEMSQTGEPVLKNIAVEAETTAARFKRAIDLIGGAATAMEQKINGLAQLKTMLSATSKVTSPLIVDLDKTQRAIDGIDRAGRAAANIKLNEALGKIGRPADQATGALVGHEKAINNLAISHRQLGIPIAAAISQFSELGPAANLASNAIVSMSVASGPAGLVLAALAITTGFLISRVQAARENLRELAEKELAGIGREGKLLAGEQALQGQLRALQSLDPELEKIAVNYESIEIKLSKLGGSEETLNQVRRAGSLEQSKIVNERLNAATKEQQQIQDQITAIDFQRLALGRTGEASLAVASAQRINAIATSELAQKHGILAQQAVAAERALLAEQTALNRFQTGRGLLEGFEQQFGVGVPFLQKESAAKLADQFIAGFRALSSQPGTEGRLSQAFSSFISQAVEKGIPNIEELLISRGIGPAALEGLKQSLRLTVTGFQEANEIVPVFVQNVFGGSQKIGEEIRTRLIPVAGQELVTALEASRQAGRQWGDALVDAARDFADAAIDVGTNVNRLSGDIEFAISDVVRLRAAIDSIPAVTRKSVIIDTFFAESPPRPFSEFLPTMARRFTDLDTMLREMTPEISFNVPDLPIKLAQIAQLQAQIAELSFTAIHGISEEDFAHGRFGVGNIRALNKIASGSALEGAQLNLANLSHNLSGQILSAQERAGGAGGGGGGGGSGPINITINISGTITKQTLDQDFFPKFEQTLKTITGKDISFQVLN